MAGLKDLGLILVLIDGILVIVFAVLGFLELTIDLGVPTGTGVGAGFVGAALVSTIIAIVIGVVFLMLGTQRIKVDNETVLGILVIILAILFTTWIGIIGGILILIEGVS